MDWKWDRPLKDGMVSNPVVHIERLDADALGVPEPTDADLDLIFKTAGYKLQTWNRATDADGKTILVDDPHWLAVKKGTPLHTDPKYPRFSHQLKVRVDRGIFVRGIDKVEVQLTRGTFYILDAHSPHQVFQKGDDAGAWNVTASIDNHFVMDPETVKARLIEYARTTSILEGAPV